MSWSLKLGRVGGIPIYVHWTFLLLIAWIALSHQLAGHDLATTVEGVVFILTLFACVVLHELGHALAANRFGVTTARITLLPIGGISQLQSIPEKPAQEFVIAVAGPLVNVVIAGSLFVAGIRIPTVDDPQLFINMGFLPRLMMVNVSLAVFNLLPAFPMDGGRVLRALLAMRLDYVRATRAAASVGQFMAVLFGLFGLAAGHPILVLIAAFVWIGAQAEAMHVQERLLLKGVRVREAMMTDYKALHIHQTLRDAAELLLSGSQHDFPVASDECIVGFLTRDNLITGLAQAGRDARVTEFCQSEIGTIEAGSMLAAAVERLSQGKEVCLKVVVNHAIVGLLTLEHVRDFVMLRAAASANSSGTKQPALGQAHPAAS